MTRTHERIEKWDIPADKDHWDVIRAADAYLRVRLGLGKKCHAGVFDARGSISEDTLHKSFKRWQEESKPLKGVVVSYGNTTDALHAQLHGKDLDREPENEWWHPVLEVTVRGEDPAEVRGIAEEAIEKAQQGIVMSRIEVPEVHLAKQPRQALLPDVSEHMAQPASRFRTVVNHQWVVGIGVTVIGTVIGTLLILWIT